LNILPVEEIRPILIPSSSNNDLELSSIKKKRKRKMNRHKYRKRLKRDRFKIREKRAKRKIEKEKVERQKDEVDWKKNERMRAWRLKNLGY
jgi:hypothetical protein